MRRVLTERYTSGQHVSKEERDFLKLLLPDHDKKMIAIVLLQRVFRSFITSSDHKEAVRDFNDFEDTIARQQAIKDQSSLLSGFQYEVLPHDYPYFDNEFFGAFNSYLTLSSGGVLPDCSVDNPEAVCVELLKPRTDRDNFCNPGLESLKYAQLVLELGADEFGDGSSLPPLHAACYTRNIDVVKELFRCTGSQQRLISVLSSTQENPLHRLGFGKVAVEIGRLILDLSPGAKDMIVAPDSSGDTPLQLAIKLGKCDLISLYLANLSNVDRHLFTDLMEIAIDNVQPHVVHLLLPFGRKWIPELRENLLKTAVEKERAIAHPFRRMRDNAIQVLILIEKSCEDTDIALN